MLQNLYLILKEFWDQWLQSGRDNRFGKSGYMPETFIIKRMKEEREPRAKDIMKSVLLLKGCTCSPVTGENDALGTWYWLDSKEADKEICKSAAAVSRIYVTQSGENILNLLMRTVVKWILQHKYFWLNII